MYTSPQKKGYLRKAVFLLGKSVHVSRKDLGHFPYQGAYRISLSLAAGGLPTSLHCPAVSRLQPSKFGHHVTSVQGSMHYPYNLTKYILFFPKHVRILSHCKLELILTFLTSSFRTGHVISKTINIIRNFIQ